MDVFVLAMVKALYPNAKEYVQVNAVGSYYTPVWEVGAPQDAHFEEVVFPMDATLRDKEQVYLEEVCRHVWAGMGERSGVCLYYVEGEQNET